MEINKGAVLSFIKNIQSKQIYRDGRQKEVVTTNSHEGDSEKSNISFDKLRGKAMSLQADLKIIQTKYTGNQSIISELSQNTSENWKENMLVQARKFNPELFSKIEEYYNPQEAIRFLSEENKRMKKELLEKQIQLENIFAAGLREDKSDPDEKITKDALHTAELFSKLRPDAIKQLLQS